MKNIIEKYLPIGSVVLIKDAKKRVMITGFVVISPSYENKIFDYMGCLYPEGVISSDKSLLFDHDDIQQVFAIGYSDEEQKMFNNKLKEAVLLMNQKNNFSFNNKIDN